MIVGSTSLRVASLCTGIGAPEVAFKPLGFRPVFFSEINEYACAVLAHHYPRVPNLGDMLTIDAGAYHGEVDVLWSSTPCQAFSLAGGRKGAADPRGALTLASVDIVNAIDPPFFIFENVPGILSDDHNAFGCFLAGLVGEQQPLEPPGGEWTNAGAVLGPRRAVAWRLLDAQHFGVAQHRERVVLVACPRSGPFDPADLLFEFGAGRLDSPPSHWNGSHLVLGPSLSPDDVAGAFPLAFRGRDSGVQAEVGDPETAFCLRASQGGGDKPYVLQRHYGDWHARRITEIECERLMGFPEGYTDVPWPRSNGGHRYRVLGNSVAVPVARWLGQRIQEAVRQDGRFD